MKRTILLISAIVFACLVAVSCGGPHAEVKSTARDFCKAFFIDTDFDKALQYTTGEARNQIESVINFRNEIDAESAAQLFNFEGGPKMKFDIKKIDVEDDEAVASVVIYTKEKGYEDFRMEETFELEKVDGRWLVSEF